MPVFITEFLLKNWKKIVIFLSICGLSLGSYIYGRHSVKPQVVEKIVEKVIEKEQSHEKTTENKNKKKRTVIIQKPNGETETVITEDETSNSTSEITKTKEKVSETTTEKAPVGKKYRVGVIAHLNPYDAFKGKQEYTYSALVSRKVFDKFWVDAQYNFNKKEAGLGLSVEF